MKKAKPLIAAVARELRAKFRPVVKYGAYPPKKAKRK